MMNVKYDAGIIVLLMNPYDDIRYDTHYIYKPQDDDLEGVQYLY